MLYLRIICLCFHKTGNCVSILRDFMFYTVLAKTKKITFQRNNETLVFQNHVLFFNSAIPLHYPIQFS